MCCWASSFFMFIGRLLLAALFLIAVAGKLMNYDATAAYMAVKNLPMIPLLLGLTIVIEAVGGLSLLFGYKVRFMATVLALYLIPVTLLMHDFWTVQEPMMKQIEMYNFLKNLGIIGGLLYVAACGAGHIGFDCCGKCKKENGVAEIK